VTLGRAALGYVVRGWHVFPVEPGGKRPLGRLAPHGLHDATSDAGPVEAWWEAEPEANIGLSCGPSGLVAVDLDVPHDLDALTALFQEYGLRPTYWSMTPSGGSHLIYRVPPGRRAGPNSAGKLAPRVDVRGAGGYIVLPPSIGSTGLYRWRHYSDQVAAEWAPEALLEPLEPPVTLPRALGPLPRVAGDPSAYGIAALRAELEKLERTPEGQRNDQLFRTAAALAELVAGGELPEDKTIHALRYVAVGIGLGEQEVQATIRSAFRRGTSKPRQAAR